MTKCSDFPRPFGTLPAGSAVRVKSRFALYSARGADALLRVPPLGELPAEAFRAPRLAVERLELEAREVLDVFTRVAGPEADERPVAAFASRLLRVADFRPVALFRRDRGLDRLVAIPSTFAKSMP